MNNTMSKSVETVIKALFECWDLEARMIGELIVCHYGELTSALLDRGYGIGIIERGICLFARKVIEKALEFDDPIIVDYSIDNLLDILTTYIIYGLIVDQCHDEAA